MQQDDVFDNAQTETGAPGLTRAAFVHAIEALKDVGQIFGGYPRTIVGDADLEFSAGEVRTDRD